MPNETKTTGLETGSHAFALVFHDDYVSVHYAEIMAKATGITRELVYLMRTSPSDSDKTMPTIIHVSSRFVSENFASLLDASTQELNTNEERLQDKLCKLQEDLKKVQPSIEIATQKVSDVQNILAELKQIGELRMSIKKTFEEGLSAKDSV